MASPAEPRHTEQRLYRALIPHLLICLPPSFSLRACPLSIHGHDLLEPEGTEHSMSDGSMVYCMKYWLLQRFYIVRKPAMRLESWESTVTTRASESKHNDASTCNKHSQFGRALPELQRFYHFISSSCTRSMPGPAPSSAPVPAQRAQLPHWREEGEVSWSPAQKCIEQPMAAIMHYFS